MTSLEDDLIEKRRNEKIESVLNHQVQGESFIQSPSREWKKIVLNHFNKIYRNELSLAELLTVLKTRGIIFSQKESLVQYPIKECLEYIAKVSKIEIKL
ncbi:hypothetical protein ACFFIX_19680 [Metabacillus herbersteinensis]|uniref:Uncharacterized protein n=1 Tax=Metabacillus herbersteinensis TaxID=283816 RepID=A0ABV6GIU4_9BACI